MKIRKNTLYKLSIVIIIAAAYLLIPAFKHNINKIIIMLSKLDIASVKDYIKSFGVWAPVVSILLMIFDCIVAPLPGIVITLANAWVFGWAWGAVISWTGAMLGAAVAFFISKIYGRPVAEKFVGKKVLKVTDGFFEKYGEHTILIARLLPFVSFHAISYAAGLTGMSFWSFFWATGIGQIPATIVYSLLGQNINKASKLGFWVVCGLAALIAFAFAIKKYLMEKKKAASNY